MKHPTKSYINPTTGKKSNVKLNRKELDTWIQAKAQLESAKKAALTVSELSSALFEDSEEEKKHTGLSSSDEDDGPLTVLGKRGSSSSISRGNINNDAVGTEEKEVEEEEEDFCDAAGKSKRPRATRQPKRYRTDSEEQKKK